MNRNQSHGRGVAEDVELGSNILHARQRSQENDSERERIWRADSGEKRIDILGSASSAFDPGVDRAFRF